MNMKETQEVATLMQKECRKAFEEGIRYALIELREVYGEGIELTDIWGEYVAEYKEAN